MRITLRELKAGLSHWVARVRAGEGIEIIFYGKPPFHSPLLLSAGGKSMCDIVREDPPVNPSCDGSALSLGAA